MPKLLITVTHAPQDVLLVDGGFDVFAEWVNLTFLWLHLSKWGLQVTRHWWRAETYLLPSGYTLRSLEEEFTCIESTKGPSLTESRHPQKSLNHVEGQHCKWQKYPRVWGSERGPKFCFVRQNKLPAKVRRASNKQRKKEGNLGAWNTMLSTMNHASHSSLPHVLTIKPLLINDSNYLISVVGTFYMGHLLNSHYWSLCHLGLNTEIKGSCNSLQQSNESHCAIWHVSR